MGDSLTAEGASEEVSVEESNLGRDLDSEDESPDTVELERALDAETEPEVDEDTAAEFDVLETEDLEAEAAALQALEESLTVESSSEETNLEISDETDVSEEAPASDEMKQVHPESENKLKGDKEATVDLDVLETESLDSESPALQTLGDSLTVEGMPADVDLEESNLDMRDKVEGSDEVLLAKDGEQVSPYAEAEPEVDEDTAAEFDVLETGDLEAEAAALQALEDSLTTEGSAEEINLAKGDIDITDEIGISNELLTDSSEKTTDELTSQTSDLLSEQSEDHIALRQLDSSLEEQADETEKEHDPSLATNDEAIVDLAEPHSEKVAKQEKEPTILEESEVPTQEDDHVTSTDPGQPDLASESRDDSNHGGVDSTEQSPVPQFPIPDVEAEEIVIEAPTKLWKMDEEIGDEAEDKRLPGWSAPQPRSVPASKDAGDVKRVRIPYPRPLITAAWVVGSIGLLLGLVWQIKGHYLTDLAQVPSLRAPLQRMCQFLSCTVPPRTDIKSIDLVSTSVDPHPVTPGALRVSANLINRAEFEQQFPPLEITLTDKEGKVVGRRTYLPHEYRVDAPNRMLPNVLERADFDLAQPDEAAVGYEIQLVAR